VTEHDVTPAAGVDPLHDETSSQEESSVASTIDEPLDLDDAGSATDDATSTGADGADAADDADPADDSEAGQSPAAPEGGTVRLSLADLLEREGEVAADYLEGLLDIVDIDGDIDMDVEGDRAMVSIIGDRLRHLIGPDGNVLEALQELTRLAVARETGVRSRLMLDVGGHRARRRTDLTVIGTKAAEEVIETGEAIKLTPMSAFERKVVHDAVAAAGLRSESEGVEPQRFVVVLPAGGKPSVAISVTSEVPVDSEVFEEDAAPDEA
jgi:spoIIIJ-associated protein